MHTCVHPSQAVGMPSQETAYAHPTKKFFMEKQQSQRVRVFCRVRPAIASEEENGSVLDVFDTETNEVRVKIDGGVRPMQTFDGCFGQDSTQAMVYQEAANDVVHSVLDGYNATLIAYGQTGSGKTYTMMGGNYNTEDMKNAGVIPQAIQNIFRRIQDDDEHQFAVTMSYLQIYLDTLQDLLQPNNQQITIRENARQGVFVANATTVDIYSLDDFLQVLEVGNGNRVSAFTNLNAQSSRSHACIICTVHKIKRPRKAEDGANAAPVDTKVLAGKLFALDLAGSERVKKSGAGGARLEEAKAINKSLAALGNCISALAKDQTSHIPYRSSILTRLLQESLGGNCLTSLIITIRPGKSFLYDTINTLAFGSRAMVIKNVVKQNVSDKNYESMVFHLEEQLASAMKEMLKKEQDSMIEITQSLKEKKDMESELSKVRNRNEKLAEELADANAKLKKLEFTNEENASEVQRYKDALQTANDQLKDYRSSKDIISSKYAALNHDHKGMQTTLEEMKTLLQEALDKIRNKDSEISKLADVNKNLCAERDVLQIQNTKQTASIDALKESEKALINKLKAMKDDLRDGFLLSGELEKLGNGNFTESLLQAVRSEHTKAIARSEEILVEEHKVNMSNLKRAHEDEITRLHNVLKLAHIPIPHAKQKIIVASDSTAKLKGMESTTSDDNVPKLKKLQREVVALKSVLNTHNKQICSRCGWGWHLFDEVFKLHHDDHEV